MKSRDIKELHNKTSDELQKSLDDLRNDVAQLSIDKTMGKVKNVNEIRQKKKDVARILTIKSTKDAATSSQAKEAPSSDTQKKEEKNG